MRIVCPHNPAKNWRVPDTFGGIAMKMHRVAAVACLTALIALPVLAGGTADVHADGTWDCRDDAGGPAGAIVVAAESYAFYAPDGKFGGTGALFEALQGQDLPSYAIIDGYLKDSLGGMALAFHGPKGHEEDYSGDIFLVIAVAENKLLECTRREAPAS
jgi:hypothetical protein